MIYYYDGSLDGLFTVIFEKYKELGSCEIAVKGDQVNFLESEEIATDLVKSERVIQSIKDNIGDDFLKDLIKVFKTNFPKKEEAIGVCIRGSLTYGNVYLDSPKKGAVDFRSYVRNFGHECHTYKGLTRFREIQDGYLLAEIEPAHDILWHLTSHFLSRMPGEKFIIYDVNRKKASLCIEGSYEEVEILEMDGIDSKDEELFRDAWLGFYDAIGIEERKNHRLMISNMPKKYWKFLPEKNR